MRTLFVFVLFFFSPVLVFSQKTLLVEKIGTLRKYTFKVGDPVKLRVSSLDTLLKGRLWALEDSTIMVSELRPFPVDLKEIHSVYKQFAFPKKFGKSLLIGSGVIFSVIMINHLINHEQVFTPDLFLIPGSFAGAGLISLSLSQKRCQIGTKWKVKVLNINIM